MSTKTVAAISLFAVVGVATVAVFHDTLLPPGAETGMGLGVAPVVSNEEAATPPRDSNREVGEDEAATIPERVPVAESVEDIRASEIHSTPDLGPIHTRARLPDSYFEHLYKDYSFEQLFKESTKIGEQFRSQQKAAFNDRYERGLYEAKPPGYRVGSVDGQQFVQSRSDWNFPNESHIVELLYGEYSNLYDLSDKWLWLRRTVRRKAKALQEEGK